MAFSQTSQFLISSIGSIINLYCIILVLRVWLQLARADFYTPLSQFVVKCTQPVLAPLRRVFRPIKNIDIAALVMIFILNALKFVLFILNFDIAGIVLLGVLGIIKSIGVTIFYVLLLGALLSWFAQTNAGASIYFQINQLNEPLLRPIRRILPTLGMIDFSPMVVLLVLLLLNNLMLDLLGNLWQLWVFAG
ncbi:YggT family protein [Haemophilus pittmaniae]|uniref:YggT family protein n=1 Tax=Haemophilus pittmaniae TaxID=249188 RepID=UPI0028DB2E4E|nr:YggT family protein [Haemophilus pittmaniae]